MSPHFLLPAQEALSQVRFQRGYRACGLGWSSDVVLHDRWCVVGRVEFDLQAKTNSINE